MLKWLVCYIIQGLSKVSVRFFFSYKYGYKCRSLFVQLVAAKETINNLKSQNKYLFTCTAMNKKHISFVLVELKI